MTSHELAKQLLEGPDLPIGAWTYTGLDTALLEINGAYLSQSTTALAVTVNSNSRFDSGENHGNY